MQRLQVLQDALAFLNSAVRRQSLARTAVTSAGIKVSATFLAFLASLLYARALGPHNYGLYSYVMAWVAILTIVANLGISSYLVREGAKDPHMSIDLLAWADARVTISGILTALLLASVYLLPRAADARWLFLIAAPLPLLINLSSVRQALLQARGRVVQSQWPQMLLAPFLALIALACIWFWRGNLTAHELIFITLIVTFIPLLVNTHQLKTPKQPKLQRSQLSIPLRRALPFMWLAGLYLLNSRIDMLMLGSLKGASEVGVYAVASRIAELVLFLSAAVNVTIAPKIARLYHTNQRDHLQLLLHRSARAYLVATVPIAVIFIFAAGSILPWLYGSKYSDGVQILQILTAAQFIVIAVGSVGTLLTMTGHEKLCMKGVGIGVVLNVSANALLIPKYGAPGAAFATGSSLALSQILLWYWVRTKLKVRPSGLGF